MKPKVYYFKSEPWGDEWQCRESHAWDEADLATEVAEEYYSDDPDNPDDFHLDIEVKLGEFGTSKSYQVTAEADVNFYASLIRS